MKSRLTHTIGLWCMVTIGVAICAVAQSAERALWVWSNTDEIIEDYTDADSISTAWDDFISFIEAPHGDPSDRIVNLYMSAYDYMLTRASHMRTFLADMSSRGFNVYVVLAEPAFALPLGKDPERGARINYEFEKKIDDIMIFQRKGNANERFAGIMLDIEPHLNDADSAFNFFDTDSFPIIWDVYLSNLTYCKDKITEYNEANEPDMTFSDAVAAWYSVPFDWDCDGQMEVLMDDIMPLVSFYTVQAYRDSSAEIADIAKEEIVTAIDADNGGKVCIVGVETMDLPSEPDITFWNEGVAALETALDELSAMYADNDGFGGFAIHQYANANIDEQAYQHLTSPVPDKAPVIRIVSPNGIQAEGISFSDDITVTWQAFLPDTSETYTVQIAYKYASDLDNDSIAWTVIDTDSNLAGSVTQSSSTFHVAGVSTTQSNRIMIKASMSYTAGAPMTTSDVTNYGVAINEAPDPNAWLDSIYADFPGYPQGLKIIVDNNNVLHATYYMYYDWSQTPGVYYARSTSGGESWTTKNLTPDTYEEVDNESISTWPRKPMISKYGNTIAIAWIEAVSKVTKGNETDDTIYMQINDANGISSGWMPEAKIIRDNDGSIYTNVDVHVNTVDEIHLIWEKNNDGISQIEYSQYTYNQSLADWQSGGIEIVASGTSDNDFLRTPSITSSAHGIHTIWGQYKRSYTESLPGTTVFNETFENYYGSRWRSWGANGGTYPENGYIKLLKDLSTLRCGLYQLANQEFSPSIDLTHGFIYIDIKTNLSSPATGRVTAEIVASTNESDNPDYTTTFSLPVSKFKDLPAASSGWQQIMFNVDELTQSEATWASPRLNDIRQVKLRIEYTGVAVIYLDNFKAVGAGTTTSFEPEMRIMARTKASTWQSVEEVDVPHVYINEQIQNNASNQQICAPVYFPEIVASGDYTYAVWQLTTLGSPDNDGLETSSEIKFSKRNVASQTNEWDSSSTIATNGYAPAISIWDNNGTPTIQILYSNNFQKYNEDAYTGNLIYHESINNGVSWSDAVYLAQGSGTASGVRRPYLNLSGKRGLHYLSYPFIFTDENGISTMNWINGGMNGNGTETGVAEEYYTTRGSVFLVNPAPPFVDFADNDSVQLTWRLPDTSFAPTGYKLRKIADNDESSPVYLNGGNTLYGLSFVDNDGMAAGVHYRYQLSYMVNSTASDWSRGSNVIKDDIYLLLDDFEFDSDNESYTGNTYVSFNDQITAEITNSVAAYGSKSLKVTYTGTTGSLVYINFPTVMDFSNYGSIDVQIRFNPEPGMTERIIYLELQEAESGEYFEVGQRIQLVNDGQWHQYHLFLDQASNKLDLDDISALKIVTWELANVDGVNGKTSFFIDDIKLNNNPIIAIDRESLVRSEPIQHRGLEEGFVINQPQTPVTVTYGNATIPWFLRIYTSSQVTAGNGTPYTVKKDGLIRYDADNDTYHTAYNLPLKVWCKNFGPPGFMSDNDTVVNEEYAVNGYPPVSNRYFFRGYDFNRDRDIRSLLAPAAGPFIESNNDGAGFYPFDLDGDGFREGDNFFSESTQRAVIGEEPAWLFVPVMKDETYTMDNDAIVMDPADDTTWRVLTDYIQGSEDDHTIDLYFAVFMGTDQLMRTKEEYGYGTYKGKIYIDMLFN